jgi:dTMP kinase
MVGLLIAIEGINGCGKTTIINQIQAQYKNKQDVVIYKFPNRNTKYGKIIDKFLRKEIQINSAYDVLDLFAKNRNEFKSSMVNDLKKNKIVICDRYTLSGIVYQIPLNVKEQSYQHYYNLISYFDKDTIKPNFTFLINGDFLHLRKDVEQRYHNKTYVSNQLFNKFVTILEHSKQPYMIVTNQSNNISYALNTITSKIEDLQYIYTK